jgi:hypothetical protein
MRRALLLVLAPLVQALPADAGAQGGGLRDKISQLFIFTSGQSALFLAGSGDPSNPAGLQAHGSHFIPSAVAENGSLITFVTSAVGNNVANVPIGSTSGGESFHFEGGVPVRTSASAGPIFGERGETLGAGRSVFGVDRTWSHFSSLRGVDLHNIELTFTHQNVNFPGCDSLFHGSCSLMGVPSFENDIMQFKLNLDLNVQVTSIYATYGVTDWLDMGVVVPIVSTSLHGSSDAEIVPFGGPSAFHYFGGTTTNPVLNASRSVDGSALGLGDVAVRSKLSLHQSARSSVALLGEARFASGNDDDLLGAGRFSARGLAIFSTHVGTFSAHGNSGFVYRAGGQLNHGVLGTLGFDDLIADRVTLAADLVTEMQVGRSKLTLPPPVHYDAPFKRTINPSSIPDMADDIVNGSVGFKLTVPGGFTVITNALVPLNRGGLRADLTYAAGLEYAF